MTVIAWDGTSEYSKESYRAIRIDGDLFLSTTPISVSHLMAAVGRDSTYQFFRENESHTDSLLMPTDVITLQDGDAFYGIPPYYLGAALPAEHAPPDLNFEEINVPGLCDGCGRDTTTMSFAPTMDGTEEYRLCATCIHNAARHQELPVGSRPALAGSPADGEVKAAMTRRMNAMFAALQRLEWSGNNDIYPTCPACGGERRFGHQHVSAESPETPRDAVSEPCPIAFALSEEASNYGLPCKLIVEQTLGDGSRFLFRAIPGRMGCQFPQDHP